ncbi:competence type IV pilus ATPase ComGA [Companilactobacillus kimchii]|uniref:Competence protein n=2 Tax=Companilactobacillus kimchii TaxID=2801452 RepID=A0ABR5NQZ1_9LACO|nr:competence type IV pilus ATPase ComGA [Companilactobacillus kimchii]GEO47835.1 competence protein ComG [Companilactobacillus paralimentarius]KAE9559129.1 competence protein [Companilactobacillus kimchii]KAE9560911.1 competence protein [Companilactobacillus kimchii]KRK50109.1 competence protein [Companilactobacillus kimchii DSM 13961 = JCM 10707]OWF32246.1 Type II secretion system protein [Companilactobacillus kimchii]
MTAESMVNNLLTEACINKISDIYFFPHDNFYHIEASNSFQNYTVADLTNDESFAIMNFLKFNGGLDVSERRRSQKGSFNFNYQNKRIFIRISSVGDFQNRESMVVRLIYPQEFNSMVDEDLIQKILPIAQRKGMMLFSGPMGSGKTSLMYTLGRQLSINKKVMCIEDPIEIVEDSFLQLQVNDDAGMTYEELIKTSLRHRPEVLIIGEIRDKQTAQQAIQAALCGYTVMSTIHGKSKYSILQRLRQFGIDEIDILNGINFISYQRLVPTFSDLKLFIDTLDASQIEKYMKDEVTDKNWQTMLEEAYQVGRINQTTYQEYIYG